MKYVLAIASLIVCGISVYGALLRTSIFDCCLFIFAAIVSLLVGLYGLYSNDKRDKRIKYLEKHVMKVKFENHALVIDNILE